MRKNFVTYDGKSTVISACDEFLEMPNIIKTPYGKRWGTSKKRY